jgi:hypothetical protein
MNEINSTAPIVPGDLFARHQTISGLRALADFLEANPAVPVYEYGREYTIYTDRGSETDGRAQVEHIADLLGVTPVEETSGHYTATKTFGRLSYRIVHIPDRAREAFDARTSYEANIRLDNQAA